MNMYRSTRRQNAHLSRRVGIAPLTAHPAAWKAIRHHGPVDGNCVMTSAQHDPASPTAIDGLGEAEALQRLKTEGPNELPQPDRRTPLRIAIEVLREPMLALLLVGGIIYLMLGDLKEAIILVAFATMSI